MMRYFMIIIYILAIIFGIKSLIFEIRKRICNKKRVIANGLKKFNHELVLGTSCMIVFVMFFISLYIRSPKMWPMLLGSMMGIEGALKLLRGIKNEIREDGIYTNKGIYEWDEINRYEWIEMKKKGSLLKIEYSRLQFYIEGGYPEKITMDVDVEDKQKIDFFFHEIGLNKG